MAIALLIMTLFAGGAPGARAATPAPTPAPPPPATVRCDDGSTCPNAYPVCVGHAPAQHCCPLAAPVPCATRDAPRTLRHCCGAATPICGNYLGAAVCFALPGLNATAGDPYVRATPGHLLADPGPWPARALPNGVAESLAEHFGGVDGGVVATDEEWYRQYNFEP